MAQHPFEEGIREMLVNLVSFSDGSLSVSQVSDQLFVEIVDMRFRDGVSLLTFINRILEMGGFTDCDLESFSSERSSVDHSGSCSLEFIFR